MSSTQKSPYPPIQNRKTVQPKKGVKEEVKTPKPASSKTITEHQISTFDKFMLLKLENDIRETIEEAITWRFITDFKKLEKLYKKLLQEKKTIKVKEQEASSAINDDINDSGWSGIMYSAYQQVPKAVDFFITEGADVTKANSVGWNSLFLLAMNEKYNNICGTCMGCFLHKNDRKIYCDNHLKIIQIAESLIEAGCDYEAKDTVGNTAKVY
mmetsp:Transcript_40408/g.39969  ORF Transcript_40408/g.39969 Transcript_40408/m.39969 type:complete len:212 (-) Transcript_40408:179-814(-)